MLKGLMARLAHITVVFDALRWVLEAGYAGEHCVIRASGLLACGRVLDLGCGTGIFAPLFAPDQYTGVDVNPRYIARARRRCPQHTFLLGDGVRVPLDTASCDGCMISGVLHHLSDDAALGLLREAARVVRPGGVLVVWEDVQEVAWWNVLGRALHALDAGAFIRAGRAYEELVAQVWRIERTARMRSGLMEYHVMHCVRQS